MLAQDILFIVYVLFYLLDLEQPGWNRTLSQNQRKRQRRTIGAVHQTRGTQLFLLHELGGGASSYA